MDRKKICRLCAKNCPNHKLTSLDDPYRCIRSKLFRCSQIDITDDNRTLPQNVCINCVKNLEQCWNFAETVAAAQIKLQLQFADDPLSGVKVEEVIIGDDQFPLPPDYDVPIDGPLDNNDDESSDEPEGCRPLGATENCTALASGDLMDRNTQITILNRMAKLEAQFEKFMKRLQPLDGSSPSDVITGIDELKAFQPIDTIEKLDEFEENLKDPYFNNKTFQSLKHICGPQAKIGAMNTCYVLVDAVFSRKLMTQVSWAGGSKSADVTKAPFKIYQRTMRFFLKLVRVSEPSMTEIELSDFFKHKAISNSKRRLIEPRRASRTKIRKRNRIEKK